MLAGLAQSSRSSAERSRFEGRRGPVRQRLNFRVPDHRNRGGSAQQTPKSRRWVSEADNEDQRGALCRVGMGPATGVAAVVPLVVPFFRVWIVDVSQSVRSSRCFFYFPERRNSRRAGRQLRILVMRSRRPGGREGSSGNDGAERARAARRAGSAGEQLEETTGDCHD